MKNLSWTIFLIGAIALMIYFGFGCSSAEAPTSPSSGAILNPLRSQEVISRTENFLFSYNYIRTGRCQEEVDSGFGTCYLEWKVATFGYTDFQQVENDSISFLTNWYDGDFNKFPSDIKINQVEGIEITINSEQFPLKDGTLAFIQDYLIAVFKERIEVIEAGGEGTPDFVMLQKLINGVELGSRESEFLWRHNLTGAEFFGIAGIRKTDEAGVILISQRGI